RMADDVVSNRASLNEPLASDPPRGSGQDARAPRQATNAEPPVIDLQRLSVTFGGRPILRELNGELRGRAIGLLGPNGAGKTTLIHTLLGFHEPSRGSASIFGRDIRGDANQIKGLVGYMPERDAFVA